VTEAVPDVVRRHARNGMTQAERHALAEIVKRNYRVTRTAVDMHRTRLMADFEAQLAKRWAPSEVASREAKDRMEAAVAQMNQEIKDHFAKNGLIKAFAPSANLIWAWRGENAVPNRRNELRKVAATRLDVQAREAKFALDKAEAEQLTRLATTGLASAEARAFLRQVPTIDQLMPPLKVDEMQKLLPGYADEDDENAD
jgi:hypothetical protein